MSKEDSLVNDTVFQDQLRAALKRHLRALRGSNDHSLRLIRLHQPATRGPRVTDNRPQQDLCILR